jgi:signal peptidase I
VTYRDFVTRPGRGPGPADPTRSPRAGRPAGSPLPDDWVEHHPYAQEPYALKPYRQEPSARRDDAGRQANGAVRPAPPNGTSLTRLPGRARGGTAVPEPAPDPVPPAADPMRPHAAGPMSPLAAGPMPPLAAGPMRPPAAGPMSPLAAGPFPPLAGEDDPPTEVLRRYVPANEVLDRETRDGTSAAAPTGTAHPPRAVVRRRRARRRALEWPFLIVFALVAAFGIRALAVQTFYIPSGSMHETLLEGDRVLVNKLGYRLHDVHRGDVVVFRRPPNFPVQDQDLIKRVIALPGERVEGRDRTVFVDGRPLVEPYVEPVCDGTESFGPITVPADQLWVMGDNRCDSSDSRVFGPIDEDLVVGRAFILIWPLGRIAWL